MMRGSQHGAGHADEVQQSTGDVSCPCFVQVVDANAAANWCPGLLRCVLRTAFMSLCVDKSEVLSHTMGC